jgi:hypothetical protein
MAERLIQFRHQAWLDDYSTPISRPLIHTVFFEGFRNAPQPPPLQRAAAASLMRQAGFFRAAAFAFSALFAEAAAARRLRWRYAALSPRAFAITDIDISSLTLLITLSPMRGGLMVCLIASLPID